jgi:radical SAM-linked protein
MRIIFQFSKLGRLRFISHLDLQRFMQRALRRARLPVSFSQGYNPHPQIAFASALAMGHTSECELLDANMAEPVDLKSAMRQFASALPPEMPLGAARQVDDGHPSLSSMLKCADYRIELLGDGIERMFEATETYMAERSVIALRKTKSGEKPADIRAMTMSLNWDSGGALLARLMLTEPATLKPDLLMAVLSERANVKPAAVRVHRTALLGERASQMISLIDM